MTIPIKPENFMSGQPSDEDALVFKFYKEHPDLACRDLLGQDLPAFQRKIIKGIVNHSYVLCVLARGSGKTRMIAMSAAVLCMFNPKMRCGFFSPGFRQSKLAFMEFESIMNESPHLQACVKRVSKQPDVWSVEFWNGAFIFALPLVANNPASIRGTRVHVAFIDEYPHIPKEVLDMVINPMLATQRNPMMNVRRLEKEKELLEKGLLTKDQMQGSDQNKIIGFSSAYFQFNHMYTTYLTYKKLAAKQKSETGKSDYAIYHFNYLDGPVGFFDMKQIEHARATSSEVAFAMEYLSEFPADSGGFFRRSLLDSCVSREPNAFYLKAKGDPKKRYIMGIDPARNDDAFAVSIIELDGSFQRLVRVITYNGVPYPEVVSDLRRIIQDYNFFLIGMDAGGGGLAVKDLLASSLGAEDKNSVILDMEDELTIGKPGRRILRMINFTSDWITQANFDMRTSLEHKTLLFPNLIAGDTYIKPEEDLSDINDTMKAEYEKTINEVQNIVMTSTKTGVLHFDVSSDKLKKDRYSALLIAHKLGYDFLSEGLQRGELATGGWLMPGGKYEIFESEEEVVWQDTRVLSELNKSKSRSSDVSGGALA